jgi:hypothetical protein
MLKNLLLLGAVFFCLQSTLFAQINQDRVKELDEAAGEGDSLWTVGAGIGLDLSQLLLLNPRIGQGESRVGLGGVALLFADYKKDRILWNNSLSMLFAVQRLGSGKSTVSVDPDLGVPFEKTIDELRLLSNFSYEMKEESKWFYSFDFMFLSQITPTYRGNYLTSQDGRGPISKFFSPAQITFSPGVKYVHNEHFSLMFSPASARLVVVANDSIASLPGDPGSELGLHGNPRVSETDFDNVDFRFGASLIATYTNKFIKDRLIFRSELRLYTNYLRDPFIHTDVDWRNELAFEIVKGLQLSLQLNLWYQHDNVVLITDNDVPGGLKIDPSTGEPAVGRRLNLTQLLHLKYNYVF